MPTGRKQVTFDLDTKALRIYYPGESWNKAYDVIKRHMESSGFVWLQGSVYVSRKPITSSEVTDLLDDLVHKNSWLCMCMRDCRETNIGKEHSKNHIFETDAPIPTRAELKEEQMP